MGNQKGKQALRRKRRNIFEKSAGSYNPINTEPCKGIGGKNLKCRYLGNTPKKPGATIKTHKTHPNGKNTHGVRWGGVMGGTKPSQRKVKKGREHLKVAGHLGRQPKRIRKTQLKRELGGHPLCSEKKEEGKVGEDLWGKKQIKKKRSTVSRCQFVSKGKGSPKQLRTDNLRMSSKETASTCQSAANGA